MGYIVDQWCWSRKEETKDDGSRKEAKPTKGQTWGAQKGDRLVGEEPTQQKAVVEEPTKQEA